jgi:hypothetical protein
MVICSKWYIQMLIGFEFVHYYSRGQKNGWFLGHYMWKCPCSRKMGGFLGRQ